MKLSDLFENHNCMLLESTLEEINALWNEVFGNFNHGLPGHVLYHFGFNKDKTGLFRRLLLAVNSLSDSDKFKFIAGGQVYGTGFGYARVHNDYDEKDEYSYATCCERYMMIKRVTEELQMMIFHNINSRSNAIDILLHSGLVITSEVKAKDEKIVEPIYTSRKTSTPIFPNIQRLIAENGDIAYYKLYGLDGYYAQHRTAIPDVTALNITIKSLKAARRWGDKDELNRQIKELRKIWKNVLNGKIKSPGVRPEGSKQIINTDQMVAAVTKDWNALDDCYEQLPIGTSMPLSVIIAALYSSLEAIEIIDIYDPEILERQDIKFIISDIKYELEGK